MVIVIGQQNVKLMQIVSVATCVHLTYIALTATHYTKLWMIINIYKAIEKKKEEWALENNRHMHMAHTRHIPTGLQLHKRYKTQTKLLLKSQHENLFLFF